MSPIIRDWKTVVDALKGYTDFIEHLTQIEDDFLKEKALGYLKQPHYHFVIALRKRLVDEAANKQIKHTPQGYPWTDEERRYIIIALEDVLMDLEEIEPMTEELLAKHSYICKLASAISGRPITSSGTLGIMLKTPDHPVHSKYIDVFNENVPFVVLQLPLEKQVAVLQDCLDTGRAYHLCGCECGCNKAS